MPRPAWIVPAFLLASLTLSAEPPRAVPDGFDKAVAPFLRDHCLRCHGPEKQSGKLRLDTLDPDPARGKDAERWNEVRLRLLAAEMPPEKEPRPDAFATGRVVDWLTAGLKANGKVTLRQPPALHHPKFGNRVDHHALFHPEPGTVASGPARVWRLSAPIYERLVTDLRGKDRTFIQPFTPGGDGFQDYAALLQGDEGAVGQLIRAAEGVVAYQTTPQARKGKAPEVPPVKEFAALLGNTAATRAQMEAAVATQVRLVLLREATDDERKRYADLMERTIKQAGHEVGVRTALTAVLLVPEALYRTELGTGPADAHGRRRLAPREVAFAVAFALTDRRPDAALLAAADQGKLATADGVAAQVKRLLDDGATDKPRLVRFFREYFGYDQATEVFKNAEDFRDHSPYVLVRDTDYLVEYVLARDKDVLAELLTTRKSYVGFDQKPGRKLGFAESQLLRGHAYPSYNLAARPDDAAQPVDLPRDQRAGVLTQPSWLVAHSENTDNHAIHRGKWVRERLLGGTIPDLPISVNAQLPDEPKKTLRERMAVTREDYCWQCHRKMNDLGLGFEMYDHFGRYRAEELGKPVDATGKVADSGIAGVDGDVPNAIAMIEKLARTERVRQVFVRHAFRFWMGRNETLADGPTLVAADRAYVASGGSMKALLVALLTSDSFLYRADR